MPRAALLKATLAGKITNADGARAMHVSFRQFRADNRHPTRAEVRIYDYVDREVPIFLRMFEKRVRGYRAIGYARDAAPLAADASADGQPTGFQIDRTRRSRDRVKPRAVDGTASV